MVIRDFSNEVSTHVDAPFCVVGAGIAGLLLATRLARQNRQVIVLESGGNKFDPQVHTLNEIDDPFSRYDRALTGRYRGLGGSSTRWGGRMIPISSSDSGLRDHVTQPQWPFAPELLSKYHHELEDLLSVGHGSFEEIEPHAAGLILGTSEHFNARWAKCPTFRRCNLATILGRELQQRPNITVWLNATVCDFDLDRAQGRLRSITARNFGGKSLKVCSQEFAIAAGTIESTRLLLLLDAAGDNRPFSKTNALGRYFQDHLKAEIAEVDRSRPDLTNHMFSYRYVGGVRRDLHLELSSQAQQRDGVSSAYVYVSMDLANSKLGAIKNIAQGMQQRKIEFHQVKEAAQDFKLIFAGAFWRMRHRQLYVPGDIKFRLMSSIEQLPDMQNRIRLSEKTDQLGVRKPLFEWSPRAHDENAFRSTIKHLGHYWRRAGYDALCPLVWHPSVADPSARIIDRAEACAHPSGSTRMGTDPTTSVVGPNLRCHAVPNVAVASASVFPTAGSANPTFTIMSMALWLADSYVHLPL